MKRRTISLVLAATLSVVGILYTTHALSHTMQQPSPEPGSATTTTVDDILDAIETNLWNVWSMDADLDCICSNPLFTFVDGFIAARGTDQMHVDMGTCGFVWWHDGVAFNYVDPRKTGWWGVRWDDTDPEASPADFWGSFVGLIDPRVILTYAKFESGPLTLRPDIVELAGIPCYVIESERFRLWLDASGVHRIVRCEIDYTAEHGGGLWMRTQFAGWATYGAQAQLPDTIAFDYYLETGQVMRSYVYALSNLQVGIALDNALFDVQDPGYVQSTP